MVGAMVLIVIGILLLAIAAMFAAVYFTFEKAPDKTARVMGWLKDTTHKKDVTVYGKNAPYSPIITTSFVKNMTKGVYVYTVGDKSYKVRDTSFGTPRQMQKNVSVIYLKKFPRVAYIDRLGSDGTFTYELGAILTGFFGIAFIILAISAIK